MELNKFGRSATKVSLELVAQLAFISEEQFPGEIFDRKLR
jgi:hypothetical protein